MPSKSLNITISGPAGAGKTSMARIIATALTGIGFDVAVDDQGGAVEPITDGEEIIQMDKSNMVVVKTADGTKKPASTFVLLQEAKGQAGHGEPGMDYLALMHDGMYELGKPAPSFASFDEAESYRRAKDTDSLYKVVELSLVDQTKTKG